MSVKPPSSSSSNSSSKTSSTQKASTETVSKDKPSNTLASNTSKTPTLSFKDSYRPARAERVSLNPPNPPVVSQAEKKLTVPPVDLQLGDSGKAVTELQECLVKTGHLTQEQMDAAQGTFDTATQDALKAFQEEKGVSPAAGYFGPKTRAAMQQALGIEAPLGALSQKYESRGDPGIIADNAGDIGGKSYGAYQFISQPNGGSVTEFVNSLKDTHPEMYEALSGKTVGSAEFDQAWKKLATDDPSGFLAAQHDYVQSKYYTPAKDGIEASLGLDLDARSKALNDVIWSTAVQHGSGGAVDILEAALEGKDVSKMTDKELIEAIYAERGRKDEQGTLVHFSGNSKEIQEAVANRFISEQADALAMLEAEGTK